MEILIRLRRSYVAALLAVALLTALNWAISNWLTVTDLAMVYLLGIVVTAVYCNRNVSLLCAVMSFGAFDFFFVPPVFTLRFGQSQYLLTGLVLLIVGLVISALAARGRTQGQLAAAASIAAAEERIRNSILASISHDLRTPLAVIAGSASSLRENRARLTADEQDQLLGAIFEQSRTVNSEIVNVLEIARLRAGPAILDRQWYPVEELVGAALQRCKPKLREHLVQVQVPHELPMIHVDGVLIEKLLVNLIENAAQYTPPGTRIWISAERQSDHVTVSIRDNGPGLPIGANELFKSFARGQSESAAYGFGLGLTICHAIATLHCARISTQTPEGGGTEFILSFLYETPPGAEREESA
jgi:two-component system, OmpR family, sensor histidine kinase KdpD